MAAMAKTSQTPLLAKVAFDSFPKWWLVATVRKFVSKKVSPEVIDTLRKFRPMYKLHRRAFTVIKE